MVLQVESKRQSGIVMHETPFDPECTQATQHLE